MGVGPGGVARWRNLQAQADRRCTAVIADNGLVGGARQPINLRPQVADIPRLLGRVIENVQRPEDLSVIGSEVDKVIRPDMVTVFWSQPYA